MKNMKQKQMKQQQMERLKQMRRMKQQSLFDQKPKRGRKAKIPHGHFGGMYLKGYNPKGKRPMDSKKALHLVLRSTKATGVRSFKSQKFAAKIWEIISRSAEKNGINIYEYANSGNHLHLLLRAKNRDEYQAFIRTITGLIARLVGKSERGAPLKEKFWDGRPFSRIVSFAAKEFRAVKSYLLRNTLEALGWMPYIHRSKQLPQELRKYFLPTIV